MFLAVRCLSRPQGRMRRRGEERRGGEEDKTLSCCRIPESVVIFPSPAFHFQRQTNTFQHLTLEKSNNFYLFFFPPSPPLMICSPPRRRRRSSQVIICLRVSRFDAGVEANIASDCQEPFFLFFFFSSASSSSSCFEILHLTADFQPLMSGTK